MKKTVYKSRSAKDARKKKYGNKSYWDYLEKTAIEHSEYYKKHGLNDLAKKMMTQSLEESLQGNNGE